MTSLPGIKGEYPNTTIGFVHIDDVIAAHILAMEERKASGRLVCSGSVAHWEQIIKMLKAKYPSYPFEKKWVTNHFDMSHTFNVSHLSIKYHQETLQHAMKQKLVIDFISTNRHCRCSNQEGDNNVHSMDTSKIQQLGFSEFKSLPHMFDDCIKSFEEKGFLWSSIVLCK